jgi:hypothetical protein
MHVHLHKQTVLRINAGERVRRYWGGTEASTRAIQHFKRENFKKYNREPRAKSYNRLD